METPLSEKRQIENEMIFRRNNERIADDLVALDAQHIKEGNPDLVRKSDIVLDFMCECSDENCLERIPIRLSVYRKIHQDRSTFILKPGHEVKAIEKVVDKRRKYSVVEKDNTVANPGRLLNATEVNNA